MTSAERFFAALEFRAPDRIPRCDYFIGDFPDAWRRHKGLDAAADPMDYYGIDITEMVGDESFMPGRARGLAEDAESETWVDGWGVIKKVYRSQTCFIHQVGAVLQDPADLDRLEFDPVDRPERFVSLPAQMARQARVGRLVMAKSGGIYIRSDGNILPVLDLLVAAGFEGFNPIEPRCGMDVVRLREKYGRRVLLMGGVCNTRILPRGNPREIETHVRPVLEMVREGGPVLGAASISGGIRPEAYEFYHSLCLKHGNHA